MSASKIDGSFIGRSGSESAGPLVAVRGAASVEVRADAHADGVSLDDGDPTVLGGDGRHALPAGTGGRVALAFLAADASQVVDSGFVVGLAHGCMTDCITCRAEGVPEGLFSARWRVATSRKSRRLRATSNGDAWWHLEVTIFVVVDDDRKKLQAFAFGRAWLGMPKTPDLVESLLVFPSVVDRLDVHDPRWSLRRSCCTRHASR